MSLFGDPKSPTNSLTYANAMKLKTAREAYLATGKNGRERRELTVSFFSSESAKVWGASALTAHRLASVPSFGAGSAAVRHSSVSQLGAGKKPYES